jgi:hypothetical protein
MVERSEHLSLAEATSIPRPGGRRRRERGADPGRIHAILPAITDELLPEGVILSGHAIIPAL